MRASSAPRQHGFTLIEVLVALFAMALLAVLSWRALDGMSRVREQTEARADQVLTLQVAMAQWAADLDAIIELPGTTPLEWNGRVLRLTRRSTQSVTDGALVVAWTRRVSGGRSMWLRWQSPQAFTRGDLDAAWQRADIWSQNPGAEEIAREVAVIPLDDWQVFFFRQNAWTNPQSSAATAVRPAATASGIVINTEQLPDGVRVVLSLPEGQAVSGTLTRDWVRPTLGRPQP